MEDAKRLRARADQAKRLGASIGNVADQESIAKIAEEWDLEATAAEEIAARQASEGS
ncbi:hypothetical protein [Phenylobacterium sp.]|uniref:hypothetical protein n=1 Tax=Phenylobacterium sp. TaxID=1871053 RepID=UPI003564D831